MLAQVTRVGAAAAAMVVGSTLAFAQVLASPITSTPGGGTWYIDVASGDRVRICDEGSTAIAVDDAGGRVYVAQSEVLKLWSYGAPVSGLVTLGSVVRAGGGTLDLLGLAFGGGRLFGTVDGTNWLYEISLTNLVATPVPMPVQLSWIEGLSYDASTGLFYACEKVFIGNAMAAKLYSLDLLGSGAVTFLAQVPGVVDTACVGNGVAYLIAEGGGAIASYDLATGVYAPSTLLAPWPYGYFAAGSEFAPSLVPPAGPRVFCHATSASACAPTLASTGSPSASAGSGFLIHHQRLPGTSLVHSHYSLTGRASAPFQSGIRCISGPVFRLQPTLGGFSSNCHASQTLDFNSVITAGTNPALIAGQTVWYQATVRPPAGSATSQLQFTPGLEFTIQP